MRRFVSVGAFALVAALSVNASAESGLRMYPHAGCQTFTDAAGDARVGDAPVGPSQGSFDMTGVSYRLSEHVFSTVVRVPKLTAQPVPGTGDTWISRFTVGGHAVSLSVSRFSQNALTDGLWDNFNPLEYLSVMTVDGKDVRPLVPSGEFEPTRGMVTISVDRAGLENAVKAPLDVVTALEVEADTRAIYSVEGVTVVDLAAAPAKTVVDATQNTCFV